MPTQRTKTHTSFNAPWNMRVVHLEKISNIDMATEHRPLFKWIRYQRRIRTQRTLQLGEPSLNQRYMDRGNDNPGGN